MKTIQNICLALMVVIALQFVATKKAAGQNEVKETKVVKDYETYKGKVIDSETKKPIVSAAVSALGTGVGTVTNSEGEFSIKLKNGLKAEQLKFAHLGYRSTTVKLADLDKSNITIKLVSTNVSLSEITVRPEDPYELLRKMMSNVDKNYCTTPNMMTSFYRESIKKRSNYIYISEAIVDIYKASYTSQISNDQSKVFKGRKSSRVKAADTIMVKLQGGPSVALLLDVIRNPYILFEEDKFDNYDMNFGEMKTVEDQPNYVIEFHQKPNQEHALFNGKLYVNAATLALTGADFSLNLENLEEATSTFIRHKPSGLNFVPISTNYSVSYKADADGKYYFNYARYDLNFTCDWKKRVFKSKYQVSAEIAITDRSSNAAQKFSWKDRLNTSDVFSEKLDAFTDENFWGEYNLIEPDRSIEDALKKYSKWLKRNGNQ